MTSRFEAPLLEQTRLWLLYRLSGASAAFHRQLVLHLEGALDRSAFERAVAHVVARHDTLRLTFSMGATGLATIVSTEGAVPVDHEPEQLALPAERRLGAALRRCEDELARPFDLEAGPLLRVRVLVTGERSFVVSFVAHAIVCDGARSFAILQRDLFAAYGAFARGARPALGEAPPPFRAVVATAHDAETTRWPAALATLREALRGASPLLELPTEEPRPPLPTPSAAALRVTLAASARASLDTLAAAPGGPFAALVAAVALTCQRHSGQADIVLGTLVSPRDPVFAKSVFGPLDNPAPLRIGFRDGMSLADVLAAARETARIAETCGEVPFERVLAELAAPRDLRHAPLFQVLVSYRRGTESASFAGDLVIRRGAPERTTSPYDLVLDFVDDGGALTCHALANRTLFDPDAIERLVAHVGLALERLAKEPSALAASVPLLLPEEHHELLGLWNETSAPHPVGCIHELFEAQTRRAPDAVALTFQGRRMTYGELSRRTSQLAWLLRGLGVGPDTIVGLSVERGLEMIVAKLGIMKAGGAYLPLDPAYPSDRLAYMLGDAGVRVLVSQPHLAERLPPHDARVVHLDPSFATLDAFPETPPETGVRPENLAYVIYTSGSTGRPKGVMVQHTGVGNLAAVQAKHFGARPGSRVLQFASMSFDASLFEMVMALLNGATLCLGAPSEVMPGPALEGLLAAERISIAVLPPTALAYMNEAAIPALETLIVAGEACPPELIDTWARGRKFVNAYGPTETTVMATFAAIRPGTKKPPIGRPMANFTAYVLGESMEPVPLGAAGELYVGGIGLARGYLNRPELTAERFVKDPFSAAPDARLYRTGDRVRYLPDATLDFLGRADDQVKIRGFRIELGEVEAAIARHASVRECAVVVATGQGAGDKRLVAFVVPEDAAPTTAELRAHAKTALPAHMVPSSFVVLAALPLTPNAKIDRKALLARTDAAPDDDTFAPPETPLEATVASVWAEVLKLDRVSVRADFFALGGHSLTAVRVAMKLEERLHVAVPLRLLFEKPTVSALAEELATRRGARDAAPAIDAAEGRDRYPLTFAQEQVWLIDGLMPGHPAYDHPIALRLRGPLREAPLRQAFDALVLRHAPLRTTFARIDDEPTQIVGPPLPVVPVCIDLGALAPEEREAEVGMLVREAARHAFDLARGPLLRVTLLRLGPEEHVLVVNLHHIVSDAWSMGLLLHDLGALYAAFEAGQEPTLPALPIQYGDYAVHQRAVAQNGGLDASLAVLRESLAGAPTRLDLPFDAPRPPIASFRGGTEHVHLDAATTDALRALARAEGASLFAALAAAFAVCVGRYAARDDLLLGVPNAGRARPELERLIGMFTNILVLRADLRDAPSFRALVRRTQAALLTLQEHGAVPFERLVAELSPVRSLAHNPLVQVAIVPQDVPFEGLAMGAVEASPMAFDRDVAQFDLVVFTREEGGVVTGWVEYAADLFSADTVRAFIASFTRFASTLARSPDASIAAVTLDAAEHARVERAARRAARELEASVHLEAFPEGPEGPAFSTIRRAFEEELGRSPLDPQDDFFELGGHSLKAARVVARLERELGVHIGLRRFFERPTMGALAAFVESSDSLREHPPLTAIAPATVRRSNLLSFGQEAFFQLDRAHSGLGYHVPLAFRVRGRLDVGALEASVREVLARHEPLRACFRTVAGEPKQLVLESVPFALPVVDLSELPGPERFSRAVELATEMLRRPFDLGAAPLLRGRVFRLDGTEHLFALSLHHIVADGWSLGILLREIEAFYGGLVAPAPTSMSDDDDIPIDWTEEGADAPRESAPASLVHRYADFAAWERRWLRPAVLDPALAFWRTYLEGAPAELSLRTDRPRGARSAHGGAVCALGLEPALLEALRGFAAERGATLFMVSLALYGLVLREASGADDLVIGAASSGRAVRDVESLIGCFFNKLALRLRPRDGLSFGAYLDAVRDGTLSAFEQADLPFELVARALAPNPPEGRTPLFQVAYAPQESGWEELRLPGATSEAVLLDRGMAPLELTLYTRESPAGLAVWFEYDTALFDEATIRGFLARFEALARAVVGRPSAPLEALLAH